MRSTRREAMCRPGATSAPRRPSSAPETATTAPSSTATRVVGTPGTSVCTTTATSPSPAASDSPARTPGRTGGAWRPAAAGRTASWVGMAPSLGGDAPRD